MSPNPRWPTRWAATESRICPSAITNSEPRSPVSRPSSTRASRSRLAPNLVVDFSLPVGQISQTVNVESEVSRVETQTAAVSSLVTPEQMSQLPLNGRNFEQLLSLAPGVQTVTQSYITGGGGGGISSGFYGPGATYSVAGSRPVGQVFLLDNQDLQGYWDKGHRLEYYRQLAGGRRHRRVRGADQHLQRAIRRNRRGDQCSEHIGHQRDLTAPHTNTCATAPSTRAISSMARRFRRSAETSLEAAWAVRLRRTSYSSS